MKKIFLIILLCFIISLSMFAIDMSPQPGDTIETVFTVMDNVVVSQAEVMPANVLYFEQININYENEICVSAEANKEAIYLWPAVEAVAVSYIGYEMGTIFYKPVENVAIYCMQYG